MLKCLPKKDYRLHTKTKSTSPPPLLPWNTLHKGERVENGGLGFALPLQRNGFCSRAISPYLQSKATGDLFLRKTGAESPEKRDRILVRKTGENRLSRRKKANHLSPSFSLTKREERGLRSNKSVAPVALPKRKHIGVICLCCTTGNTICTLLDSKGQTKGFATCGSLGFTNSRKRTSYASQAVAEKIGLLSKELGFTTNLLIVKGVGRGKGSAIRAFRKNGINILGIDEKTSLPHNGCRSCRKRRK